MPSVSAEDYYKFKRGEITWDQVRIYQDDEYPNDDFTSENVDKKENSILFLEKRLKNLEREIEDMKRDIVDLERKVRDLE